MTDPVLDVLVQRARDGSRAGCRDDGNVVALAIEGGGMRGAVSAGMCAVLESAGLIACVDRIYDSSTGALTRCYAAAGQAVMWTTTFEDLACRAFIDPTRVLRERPMLDLDYLFGTVAGTRKPLSAAGLARGPACFALAVTVADAGLRVLGSFSDVEDALAAARVSCTVPLLGGTPGAYRGERMVDGALLEALPYLTALREGATHVLVLRTRHRGFRGRPRPGLGELTLRWAQPELEPLIRDAGRRYNRDAAELERLAARRGGPAVVSQVAVRGDSRLAGRLCTDAGRVAESLRLGAAAMARALYGEPAQLMWRPVPYRLPTALDAAA